MLAGKLLQPFVHLIGGITVQQFGERPSRSSRFQYDESGALARVNFGDLIGGNPSLTSQPAGGQTVAAHGKIRTLEKEIQG